MGMISTVVIVESLAQLEYVLQKNAQHDFICFSEDVAVQRALEKRELQCVNLAQVLSATELEAINARAAQWHAQWLSSLPEFSYRKLPIATGLIQFYEPWARALKRIYTFRALVQKFQPTRLLIPAEDESLVRQVLVAFPVVELEVLPRAKAEKKSSWFLERIRYRGGWRKALRFYADYWWNETPLGKQRVPEEKTPAGYILFCTGYINHAKTFLPILRRLQLPRLVLALSPEPCAYFRRREISYYRLGHFVTWGMYRAFQTQLRWIKKHADKLTATLHDFHYENVAVAPMVESDLRRLLRHQFARLCLYADAYLDLLQRTRPGHVVVADDTTTHGRVLVMAAQALGIPTLNIQHGAIADVQHYRHALADRIAVWGEHDRELLVQNGVLESRIVITGQPRFEVAARADEARMVRQALHLPADHKLILWATTPYVSRLAYDFPERNQRYLEALLHILSSEKDWRLLIKLHPVDQRPLYERLLRKSAAQLRGRVRLYQQEDIQELLIGADVLLAWNTSVIQEAALLGKPIVGMNFFAFPESIPSVSTGIALPATNEAQLTQSLRSVLRNEGNTLELLAQKREAYVRHYLNVNKVPSAVTSILQCLNLRRSS